MAKKRYKTKSRESRFLSRRQAAMILGVIPPTLDKLATMHGLTIRQVPGHSRRHFVREEILALLDKSHSVSSS